jgi:hypothetical protein
MISIIHPSRSRPHQALTTSQSWIKAISQTIPYEYILSVDKSDPQLSEYEELFYPPNVFVADNHNVVQAANAAAKESVGDILILISDDFMCFPYWDLVITDALRGKSGVLKTFDGVQRWIVTLPIMTRDYYEEQGYFYYPRYEHMFCDTDQTHKADLQKKLIIRNDIVFKHDHYSVKGQPKDAVNIKADKTWAQGEMVYLNRCRNQFGISEPVNIYNLSPEATKAGHVRWLQNKLMKGVRA